MDLQKTKIYLDKLTREFARMQKDPENIVRLDVDIMLDHIRQLYDAVLSEAAAPPAPAVKPDAEHAPTTKRHVAPARPAHQEERPIVAAPTPPTPPPPPPVVVAPPAPDPIVLAEALLPTPEPVAYVPAPPPPPVVEPPAPEPVRSAPASSSELDLLFEEKQAKELSEKLSELPIPDLRKAIALNDRLLLTRELFSGDGQAFDAALHALNSFSTMQEAKDYLAQHVVIRFGWLDKKRSDTAKNFIKLVRRRYK